MKYIKKPIPIEALQWTGTNVNEMLAFMEGNAPVFTGTDELIIHTLEGDMNAAVGSYIIKGIEGEFYPCREDIFLKTYQPYDEKEYVYEFYCPYCNQKNNLDKRPELFFDELNNCYKYRMVCPKCHKIVKVDKL